MNIEYFEYVPCTEVVMFAFNNTLGNTTNYQYEEVVNNKILFNSLQKQIGGSLTNFLSTISRGMARGDERKSWLIVENGQFNEELLPGLQLRLPVNPEVREQFYKMLSNDLQKWVYTPKQIGLYALLIMVDNNIILMNTHSANKPLISNWNKATEFIPKF